MDTLTAKLSAAQAKIEYLTGTLTNARAVQEACIAAERSEIKRLKTALARYGGHTDDCNFWNGHHKPGQCTCGLNELLLQIGPVETLSW